MRGSLFMGAALFALQGFAFPSMLNTPQLGDLSPEEVDQLNKLVETLEAESLQTRDGNVENRGFDPEYQLVDIHGEHEFRAPGPGDLRGPCPGLNAMANHGYIPHNGVSTVLQMTTASQKVFGMSIELAAFLSVYSAVFSGDLVKFSIGGKPPADGLLNLGGLLGEPRGLSHSHNNFECDGSPSRKDMYANDNPSHNVWDMDMDRFERLMSKPLGPHGIDLTVLQPFRLENLRDSIKNNPYFWQGPYTKLAIEPATYIFTYRFYGNWSADADDGYLSRENYATFMGVEGEPGNYKYKVGHERIPENWYKRSVDFNIPAFSVDSIKGLLKYPDLIAFGGNMGKGDSFAGVSVSELTGGVYNLQNLLEGDNAICLAMQTASMASPDLLKGLVSNVAEPLSRVLGAVGKITSQLSCPELKEYNLNLFKKFPGAKGAY